MKGIITLAFVHFITLAIAQTPLILHKSHSGSSISYFIDPSSNFGAIKMDFDNPSRELKPFKNERFRPLNDSIMILEVTDYEKQIIKMDTLSNKERYATAIFQLKYQDSIRKEEQMKQYQDELKWKEELQRQEKEHNKQFELQQQQLNETPKKKEKKSYLLFLFGITGGGILLMKLFSRAKTIQQSIV